MDPIQSRIVPSALQDHDEIDTPQSPHPQRAQSATPAPEGLQTRGRSLSLDGAMPSRVRTPSPTPSQSEASHHTDIGMLSDLESDATALATSGRMSMTQERSDSAYWTIELSASMSAEPPPQEAPQAAPAATPAHPAGLLARAGQIAGRIAHMADARTMVTRGDDARFLSELRGDTAGREPLLDVHLPQLRGSVAEMRETLRDTQMPESLRAHFTARLSEVDSTLKAMQTDQPLARRMAVYLPMNTLLPVLPLAIPAYSRQNQFEAELAGLYAKTALMAVGSMRSTTSANRHSAMDHFMSRHYINVVQAAVFALPTFVGKLQKANANIGFNLAAGAVSTSALLGGFFGKEIKEMFNTRVHGSPHPHLTAAGAGLSEASKLVLANLMASAQAGQQGLSGAKSDFVAQGHELSPATSKQVTMAANAFLAVANELGDTLGARADAPPDGNSDRTAKLALALFSSVVCGATTALMYPDKIGMVDLASDAVFTTVLMLHNTANPNVTRHDALEEFKSFVGLSLVMIGLLAANHAAGDFIDKSPTGLMAGSIAMAVLNVTVPGPVGHLAGAGIEKLLGMPWNELGATLKAVGDNALGFFRNLTQQRVPASGVTLEEIPDTPSQTTPEPV